jgi:hypothetical protein
MSVFKKMLQMPLKKERPSWMDASGCRVPITESVEVDALEKEEIKGVEAEEVVPDVVPELVVEIPPRETIFEPTCIEYEDKPEEVKPEEVEEVKPEEVKPDEFEFV